MGMLFRMLAPKPLKKARRVAHPVSMVTPRPVKRAKMAAVNTANPAGAAKRAAKRAAVREVRGSGKSAGRVLSAAVSGLVGVGAATAMAGRGVETGAPLMEFASDQHGVEYERIKGLVAQLFGEAAQLRDDMPSFQIRVGSETVFIHLIAGEDVLMNYGLGRVTGRRCRTARCVECLSSTPILPSVPSSWKISERPNSSTPR